jgi:hypothetical protein
MLLDSLYSPQNSGSAKQVRLKKIITTEIGTTETKGNTFESLLPLCGVYLCGSNF